MVSKTAQADIEDMWDAGLKPTVADIIRLNALGLVVENASRPTEALYYLRRCAWLGDVVFKQPLMAHDIWLKQARRCVADDWLSNLAVKAFMCCVEPSELPDPDDPSAIEAAVNAFAPKLSGYTQEQIAAAVMYAMLGNDWRTGETAAVRKDDDKTYLHFSPELCIDVGVIYNGLAIGVGLTVNDAMNLPRRTFDAIVERKLRYDGACDMKRVADSAEDDYLRTYDEIAKRLKGTNDG